ncbi:response regulator transcription factor [Bacillus anthracis]|uniref:response regulator transcription factor n=1 Tax=Bacillus anthracis TaxID=1392 RepID=UPI001ADF9D18|nr:response regulator transcription factor [Bacillus anthracis]MBP0730403.1 response regulator transcription factor [Bacillus anthracis]MBP0790414.1 response regulator transcription factor [Bacillus anthracis]MBP0811634.1 response regulator transcription factor [Bacillus anthracis]MBP0815894.1 response regulator transcription factor [Bacillus anthracis]MBP0821931.1 response regulator transcription factor [Bacillus anthracis]
MVKILLVDDEERMLRLLDLFLSPRGYFCMKATSGLEALKLIEQKDFDIILLDVMMPNMDGWDTYYQIRQISNVPIIMLTARNQNYDMVKGLTMGADDYITKPFDEHVLVARIEAILRRTKKDGFVSFNGIEWDKTKHTVTVYDEKISLTPIEFSLLGLFLQNTNRAYSRDDLIEKIWGYETDIEYRTIDSHIRNIRDKLRKKGFPVENYLETVYKVGYKWKSE